MVLVSLCLILHGFGLACVWQPFWSRIYWDLPANLAKVVSLPANRDDRNTSLLNTGLWIILMDICIASSCLFRLCVLVLPLVELLTFLTSCSIRLNRGKLQKSVFRSAANFWTGNLIYISSFFFPLNAFIYFLLSIATKPLVVDVSVKRLCTFRVCSPEDKKVREQEQIR